MKHVAVVGGGLAGLAAGVEMSRRGWRVTVFEAKPRLGGRAYSFTDEASGEIVDNGQHAMMGCYTETLAFLDRIGAGSKIARQRDLDVAMVHRRYGTGRIRAASLPSPLHMLSGVLGYELLSRRERLNALLGGARLMVMHRRRDPRLRAMTVEQILVLLGQSENCRQSFWYPVAIATLNELPERACAAPFATVLERAFFSSRSESQFVFAKVGLSDLYTDDARRFIERHGGAVEIKSTVADLQTRDDLCTGLRLRDGRTIDVDACIAALPPRALRSIAPQLDGWGEFASAPIVSVHLWIDRPVLDHDFTGFIGTTTQWLFNRSRMTGQPAGSTEQLSAVISAAHEQVEQSIEHVAETVIDDVRACLPKAREAKVLRRVTVKEKHATISLTPEAERRRPGSGTPLRNLFLAGDWIQTGLPATIESAVVSGHRAAAFVARDGYRH